MRESEAGSDRVAVIYWQVDSHQANHFLTKFPSVLLTKPFGVRVSVQKKVADGLQVFVTTSAIIASRSASFRTLSSRRPW